MVMYETCSRCERTPERRQNCRMIEDYFCEHDEVSIGDPRLAVSTPSTSENPSGSGSISLPNGKAGEPSPSGLRPLVDIIYDMEGLVADARLAASLDGPIPDLRLTGPLEFSSNGMSTEVVEAHPLRSTRWREGGSGARMYTLFLDPRSVQSIVLCSGIAGSNGMVGLSFSLSKPGSEHPII